MTEQGRFGVKRYECSDYMIANIIYRARKITVLISTFFLNLHDDSMEQASYMIVDEMHEEHPELLKDQYWEEVVPKDLPYTVASEHYRRHEPKGSAETYKVKESDAVYANIMPGKRSLNDDVYADYESVDTPMVERRKNWFSRQMHRMGSMRSSSTAYSSGSLFNRNRLNSGNLSSNLLAFIS